MELAIAGGVLALGYALQNNSKNKQNSNDVTNAEVPSVNNMYKSNYSIETRSQEQKKVEENHTKSKKPIETNIIPKHFNENTVMSPAEIGRAAELLIIFKDRENPNYDKIKKVIVDKCKKEKVWQDIQDLVDKL